MNTRSRSFGYLSLILFLSARFLAAVDVPVLTSIGVTPHDATIVVNTTLPIMAVGLDQNQKPLMPQPVITFSVNDGGTVDAKGLFTATKVGGPYTVTATSGTISAPVPVTVVAQPVNPPVLTSIAITPRTASIPVNTTLPIMAVGLDQNQKPIVPQPAITFSVNDGGTVDAKGVFTATKVGGPYTVTATSGTLTAQASITVVSQPVNPPPPVLTSIGVTPHDATIVVNTTVTINAVGLDQNQKPLVPQPAFTFAVNDGGTVDASGVFTATKVGGPYTVTATSGTVSAKVPVTVVAQTVNPVLTSILVQPGQVEVPANTTFHFIAIARDQGGLPMNPQPAITWSVSGGGTIDSTGAFAATTAGGPYTVTATSGTIKGTAQAKVDGPVTPPANQVLTSVAVWPHEGDVKVNDMLPFKAAGLDQNGQPMATQPAFTWTVSGGGTIDANGVFKATTAGGPFTVTATSGTVNGTAKIKVEAGDGGGGPSNPPAANPVLTSVVVFPHDAKVQNNTQLPFIAVGRDQNGAPMPTQPTFTWSVSGGGTIDENGIFSATTVGGPYTITATAGTLNGTASVSVTTPTPPPPAQNPVLTSISVLPHEIEIPVNVSLAFIAIARDQNGAPLATQPAITWSSTPAGAVSATGVFKSSAGGEFTVTATSGAVSGTAQIEVFAPKTPPANQVLTTIVVGPKDVKVALNGTVNFKARGLDQNGVPMAQQPTATWTVSAGGTIDANGVFTGTTTGGAYTVTATSGTITGTTTVTVLGALGIASGPIALPNPAFVGDNVHFGVFALGTGTLTSKWDFGDSTTGTGQTTSHVYTAAGTYTATVTVTDTASNTVTGTVSVVVITTGTPVTGTHTLSNVALSAKLDYSKSNNDSLGLAGTLSDFDATTQLAGLVVSVKIGSLSQSFTLDANGSASIPNATLNFSATNKTFAAKITNGSFASAWAAEGIDPTVNTPLGSTLFPVTLTVNGVDYAGAALVRYSSRPGKGAMLKPTSLTKKDSKK